MKQIANTSEEERQDGKALLGLDLRKQAGFWRVREEKRSLMPDLRGQEAGQWEPNKSVLATPRWGRGWALERELRQQDTRHGAGQNHA